MGSQMIAGPQTLTARELKVLEWFRWMPLAQQEELMVLLQQAARGAVPVEAFKERLDAINVRAASAGRFL